MEKVVRDGKVAVLVSPGFGAGWYSWNRDQGPQMLFDPTLVKLIEQDSKYDVLVSHCKEVYPTAYLGGLADLEIRWISKGAQFRIDEYDGSEAIETNHDVDWIVA